MKKNQGFSLLEILVSVGIISVILLVLNALIFGLYISQNKSRASGEALEYAKRVMGILTYEISGAKGVYTPTTSLNQLSLETKRYVTNNETTTFIDFFICNNAICLKKEGQSPVALNSDAVEVKTLEFSHIANGASPSVKINVTFDYKNPANDASHNASVNLVSTVALRGY